VTGAIFIGDVDAGESLRLTGPNRTLAVPRSAPTALYNLQLDPSENPPPVFAPGTWQIAGPGGKTIAPFQAETTLPPPIRWANRDALSSIDRRQDQNVAWDASGYADSDVVIVTLAQIICRAPAKSGSLTIPATLLQSLPDTIARPTLLRLGVGPRPDRRTLFTLSLTDGSMAHAVYEYSFSDALPIQLR
jgi:hypothetical protein